MELIDIYDNNMKKTGITKKRDEKLVAGEYHLSIHFWMVNDKEILIQKRSNSKKVYPNMWSIITGGVISNEVPEEACDRECFEEIGIKVDTKIKLGIIKRKYDFVNIFVTKKLPSINNIIVDKEEVEECKIVDIKTFELMIESKEIVNSIINEYFAYIKPFIQGGEK